MPNVAGGGLNGQVRVELDTAGRVQHVAVDAAAMAVSPAQLGAEIVAAFQAAQDKVAAGLAGRPGLDRLTAASAAAMADAERRFGEISGALYDLDRRAGREW
jgi:hypothetical protein